MRPQADLPSRWKPFGILCLTLTAVWSVGALASPRAEQGSSNSTAPVEGETRYQREFQLSPGGRLLVNNRKGKISVEGWDRNQVLVDIYKNFEGSDYDRKWWMAETDVKFSSQPRRLDIEVEYPNHSCFDGDCDDGHGRWGHYTGAVELTIHVPRQVNVELSGHKPEMRVASIQGDVAITSHKSPIEIRSTVGAVRIHTYKETVKLTDIDIRGALDLKMYKGEALIDLKNLGERADLETGKGEIVMRVPEGTGLSLEVEGGRRASFHSDFPVTTQVNSGYLIRGTINQGGPRVRLRTEKGSILLQKRGGV